MSREFRILTWCDACDAAGRFQHEALHTYTVGIVNGETRPELRVLELCDEHNDMVNDLSKLLTSNSIPLTDARSGTPPTGPKAKTTPPPPSETKEMCRVCGGYYNKGSLSNHVWGVHRADEERPLQPARCPDCNEKFPVSQAMSMHRNRSHGYRAVDDAYDGLALLPEPTA